MYKYNLPSGLTINAERLAEAVTETDAFPQTYLDIETGALIEIPSPESLGVWIKEMGHFQRYFLVEPFTVEEMVKFAKEFVEVIMSTDVSKSHQVKIFEILKKKDLKAFEDYLFEQTDGWIHGWDQYIADKAWEYVHQWLTSNPHVKIEASFDGCGNCAICTAMSAGKGKNMSDLLSAFNTETVMQSVQAQLQKQASDKNAVDSKKVAITATPVSVSVFKVTLNHSKPAIWRRIVVPDNYTFYELHCAIQDAMGWFDYHLHSFTFDFLNKKNIKSSRDAVQTISLPNGDVDMFGPPDIDESKELIKNWFDEVTKQCIYTYDFGDNWDHTIVLEEVLPIDKKQIYPQCTGGKNACPPEDCGGVWGYENLKAIMADPKHSEHKDMLDWLDLESAAEFSPGHFDPVRVEFDDPKKRLQEWQDNMEM